jgi:thiosulfate dehydrogenase [quinone] large subunit
MQPPPPPRPWADHALAQALLRWTLALNLLGHGANRLPHIGQFVEAQVRDFAPTPVPAVAVRAFALALPLLEAIVGALLLCGLATRAALVLGALLMMPLVFGTALLGRWEVLTQQMIYAAIYFFLLRGLQHDRLRLGAWLEQRRAP